jgi:hypothetical protein
MLLKIINLYVMEEPQMKSLAALALISAVLLLNGCALVTPQPISLAPKDVTGVVFNDINGNGLHDPLEPGLPGVKVSNGTDIVLTDSKGQYSLNVEDNMTIFVIKPAGWMTKVDENKLPRFFYIHKPYGSPAGLKYPGVAPTGPKPDSIDFPLYRRYEPERFDVVIFGDTQVSKKEELAYLAHDAIEEVAGIDAAFGVSLGDIVGNNINDLRAVNELISAIGLTWYNVPGNHDMNFYAESDEYSLETFNSIYGPIYYSFDYGKVHFLVLDSIVAERTQNERLGYKEGLDKKQLEFIRNDLALLDKGQFVVLLMHGAENLFQAGRRELFEALEKHPHSLSIAGHDHRMEHLFLGKDHDWHGPELHHLYVAGAVCGGWWNGTPDELGIPHSMTNDGTPNGYSVLTFDGNRYSIRFKAFRRSADYQMNIWAPEQVTVEDAPNTKVFVNIFAGSKRSKVRMKVTENGKWLNMEQVTLEDPYFVQLRKFEEEHNLPRVSWAKEPFPSGHIFRAKLPKDLPKGVHFIHVRSGDMFGQIHTARRLIKIR